MASSSSIATDPAEHVDSTPSAKTVVLTSSGGEKFEVQLQVALQSETIRKMIADGGFSDKIVLSFPDITGGIMSKVVEYWTKRLDYDAADNNILDVDEMRAFETQFLDVPNETLLDLILAANYLNIKGLLDLVMQKMNDMIKGKTPEEFFKSFSIKNHFTPEEEEEIHKENTGPLSKDPGS